MICERNCETKFKTSQTKQTGTYARQTNKQTHNYLLKQSSIFLITEQANKTKNQTNNMTMACVVVLETSSICWLWSFLDDQYRF